VGADAAEEAAAEATLVLEPGLTFESLLSLAAADAVADAAPVADTDPESAVASGSCRSGNVCGNTQHGTT
jgi:hypothetical protein